MEFLNAPPPEHQNVVKKSFHENDKVRRTFQNLVVYFPGHEDVCVGHCRDSSHCCADDLKEIFTIIFKDVVLQNNF